MTNIWTDTFKEIREPFFNIEDPYTITEEKEDDEKEEKGEKKHKEGKKEEESEDAGEKFEKKYKKSGKKSKDYDGDGEVEDESDEYAGVKDRAIKKAMKEERDLHSKKDKNEKLDVRRGVKNKITINPSIKEEVELWVDELLEEGYDLSEFTWEELEEIYEANSTEIPPKGDAERQSVDASVKRRTAQMQIRKELADVQLARAKAAARQSTNESVMDYLANRYNIFG